MWLQSILSDMWAEFTFRGSMLTVPERKPKTGFEMSPVLLTILRMRTACQNDSGTALVERHPSNTTSSYVTEDRGGILVTLFVSFASTEVVPAQRPSRWRSISDQRKTTEDCDWSNSNSTKTNKKSFLAHRKIIKKKKIHSRQCPMSYKPTSYGSLTCVVRDRRRFDRWLLIVLTVCILVAYSTSVRHSKVRLSTFDVRHSTFEIRLTDVWHSTFLRGIFEIRFWSFDIQHSTFDAWQFVVQRSSFDIRRVTFDIFTFLYIRLIKRMSA